MLCETIPIQMKGSSECARLCIYVLDSSERFQRGLVRPTILLCPGGGYEHTSDREAEPVAMRLLAKGYHVGILRYSVAPARFPTALIELAQAMRLVHENAVKWHVDVGRIFVQGFSAGGHLAACLGVFWDTAFLRDAVKVPSEWLKPAGLILCYPVITSEERYTHEGSFRNLLGKEWKERKEQLSIERQVSAQTPPCFIWHTYTDETVPVENSLLLFSAFRKYGIPVELHIYPEGGHGLALGDASTSGADKNKICKAVQSWIDLLGIWLERF